MSIDDYGYDKGLLSNSMIQTAQFCSYKFNQLYVKESKPEGLRRIDATTLGSLAHVSLEHMEQGREAVMSVFYGEAAGLLGIDESTIRALLNQTSCAIDAVMVYGKRQGKTYVAPKMTRYWQNNFHHLDEAWKELQKDLSGFSWVITLSDFLADAYMCVQNELAEPSFNPDDWDEIDREVVIRGDFHGSAMVGTVDILLKNANEVRMIDYKTGRKEWEPRDVQHSDQFCLYTYLLEQMGLLGDGRLFMLGVKDLRRNSLCLTSINPVAMDLWDKRYRKKVETARAGIKYPNVDLNIPFGSGFHPGCPCELSSSCPYVVE